MVRDPKNKDFKQEGANHGLVPVRVMAHPHTDPVLVRVKTLSNRSESPKQLTRVRILANEEDRKTYRVTAEDLVETPMIAAARAEHEERMKRFWHNYRKGNDKQK